MSSSGKLAGRVEEGRKEEDGQRKEGKKERAERGGGEDASSTAQTTWQCGLWVGAVERLTVSLVLLSFLPILPTRPRAPCRRATASHAWVSPLPA